MIALPHASSRGNTLLILGVIAAVALLAGGTMFVVSRNNSRVSTPSPTLGVRPTQQPVSSTTQNPSESSPRYTGTVLAGTASPLLDFRQEDYDAARTAGKLVVVYFYANWCPICAEEFPLMQAAFNELGTDQVVGFRVNYNDNETDDAERALAREHGIAYQHTKIFVRDGQRILKSPETWSKERYLTEISNALGK